MSQRKLFKKTENNENEKTTYQNMWDTVKAVPRKKFIALNFTLEKKKRVSFIILTTTSRN